MPTLNSDATPFAGASEANAVAGGVAPVLAAAIHHSLHLDIGAFLTAALETSNDAIIGAQFPYELITLWSAGAEALYGWSGADMLGKPVSLLLPDDQRTEFARYREGLMAQTLPNAVFDTTQLRQDGSQVDVTLRMGLVRDPETSQPTGLCLVATDRSARTGTESDHDREQVKDKQIALALQRPLLFQPDEDAFTGLMVQTAYAMASEDALVGGDFWDTFAYDHGHVALVLGDVMGHGLSSAIFTTELKHTMRAYIREHEQPGRILFHMNQFLYQSNRLFMEGVNTEGSDSPVCIALAVIERDTGAGSLAIAGMEPPMLVRARGDTEQSAAIGLPLGIEPNQEYEAISFQLEAGDTLILSTDGITEARNGRDFLDAGGLMRLAVEANDGSLKEMADAILNGARNFAGGKLKDDAALVLVRRSVTSPVIEPKSCDP
jgi:PAS domain S-box-containing protein